MKRTRIPKSELTNFTPPDLGSLHPDEISPLDSLQQILVPSVGQLHKTREVWGLHPETLAKRLKEKARNEALAHMTSLQDCTKESLFEIALLRSVLVHLGMNQRFFSDLIPFAIGYVSEVVPDFGKFGETEKGLNAVLALLEQAKAQLVKDTRIKEEFNGFLCPTGEAVLWFEKWREQRNAEPFSHSPSDSEKQWWSPAAKQLQQLLPRKPVFMVGAQVRHRSDGIGRIKAILDDHHVLVRFRCGGCEYSHKKDELELIGE